MKATGEIRPIKEAAEAKLLERSGVTGVDIGAKYVDGKKTDELSIRVYVVEKKKKEDVLPEDLIPDQIDGVKTDVIEREFILHTLRTRVSELELQADTGTYDPLKGGISIGPCRSIGGYIYTGTLGSIVRDNSTGNPMLLSNFHVMCVDDAWSVGDKMAQPSRVDTGSCPADVVGKLQRASLGGKVDCAVASHEARGHACEIVDLGAVKGTATAVVGSDVRKRGRTTGLTYGKVDTVDLTVSIDYGDGLGVVTLTKQIGIDVDTSKSSQIGDKGDSGSVVVDSDMEVVGLYFAGNSTGTYGVANPISEVLTALDVSMCSSQGTKKLEKLELKEKLEVIEKKSEMKEFDKLKDKIEIIEKKREIKEFEKLKEKNEKNEFEKAKEIEKGPGEPKGWLEGPPKSMEGMPPRPEVPQVPGPLEDIDRRLARIERAMQRLQHFIDRDLRPDLSRGALKDEPE